MPKRNRATETTRESELPTTLRSSRIKGSILARKSHLGSYGLEGQGNCLAPAFNDGDIAICSSTQRPTTGELGIFFRYAEQPLIKWLVSEPPPPDAIHEGRSCKAVTVVEMTSPPERLGYPAEKIEAVHRVVDRIPKGVQLPDSNDQNLIRSIPSGGIAKGPARALGLKVFEIAPRGCYAICVRAAHFDPLLCKGEYAVVRPGFRKLRNKMFAILEWRSNRRSRSLVQLRRGSQKGFSAWNELVWTITFETEPIGLLMPDGTISISSTLPMGDYIGEAHLRECLVGEVIGVMERTPHLSSQQKIERKFPRNNGRRN
ncbi:MAG: hypothetical protein ACTHPD_07220 [Rhizomicrobium sp.]